jgi:epithelial splicing regulatory protein 1/2
MQPDVQLQRGSDGRATGEAYVTFASRSEAERAITERNRKVVGNRFVEMFMA